MKMKIKRQSLKYLIISVVLFAELYFIFTFHGKSNTDIVLNAFKSYSLLIILSIYAFGRLYPAITKIRLRIYEALFCLGGGIVLSVSPGFEFYGSSDFIFKSFFSILSFVIAVVGWALCIYIILANILLFFITYRKDETKNYHQNKILNFIYNEHQLAGPMLLILLLWLPHMIIFYPGGAGWDAINQVNQYAGSVPLTNHHPVFSTYLMGIIIGVGQKILDDNFGMFLYNILQSILAAAIFSYGINILRKTGANLKLRFIATIFYGLLPLFSGFFYTLLKDSMYAVFTTLFVFSLIDYYIDKEAFIQSKYKEYILMLSILLMCLLRKNGFYIAAITAVIMLLKEKYRKNISLWFIMPLLIFMTFNYGITKILMIPDGSLAESMSIPFQQTARYVRDYGNEITEEERRAIDAILDFESIGNNYNPDLSDPVKGTYKEEAGKKEWLNYLDVWLKDFFKHPRSYVDATFANTYGYYYPLSKLMGEKGFYYIADIENINNQYDFFYSNKAAENIRNAINRMIEDIDNVPIIGLLYEPGIYTWAIFCILFTQIRRKTLSIKIYVPILLSILVCIASPVNAYLRYFLPVITLVPILIGLQFYRESGNRIEKFI